ncbi:MAG: glycosyltransferase family 2 protein [Thermomicrobiales bacterium]
MANGTPEPLSQPATVSRRLPARIPGSLSLVLPAHNEEENIEVVVKRALHVLPAFADDFEVIVVDDGSRDQTPLIVDALAETDHRVKLIHHSRNRGYGGALISGFEAATGDFVMFMDADRQFDVADIGLLAPFVDRFDIVAGFRMERNDPLHRRVFAEIFNVTVRVLFGVHLRDIDCAFKIFRGDLLRSIVLTSPGALINTEIQAKARRHGATIEQVGVHHYPRVAGEASGGSIRVILRAMRETVALWWRMHDYKPPSDAPDPRGPHIAGDLLLALLAIATLGTVVATAGRWRRKKSSLGFVTVER